MSALSKDDLELIQARIDDWDWDVSQRNDVYELLPKVLAELAAYRAALTASVRVLKVEHPHDEMCEVRLVPYSNSVCTCGAAVINELRAAALSQSDALIGKDVA